MEGYKMTPTAQQVWTWIGNNLWQIIIFGSLFIQIAPIKIKPVTLIIKWIGNIITTDLQREIK